MPAQQKASSRRARRFDRIRPSMSLIPLWRTFLIAKTQQQRFKLIKRLLRIGPDGLQHDTVTAI